MTRRPPRRPAGGAGLLLAAAVAVPLALPLPAGAAAPATPAPATPAPATPAPASTAPAPAAPPTSPAPSRTPDGEEQALALLQRAVAAARTEAWSGTQFVAAWSRTGVQSAVVDVTHDPGTGARVRVRPTVGPGPQPGAADDAPDGAPVPGPEEPAQDADAWVVPEPGDVAGIDDWALGLLADNYRLSVAGAGRSADRAATVVVARRPEGGTAARFWLDDETGLVLQRELLDRQGSLVRVSYFVDLERTADPLPAREPAVDDAAASGEVLTPGEVAALRGEGWVVPARLPRGLTLLEVRRHQPTPAGPTMHLAYSDGLATLSVFVQEGSLEAADDGSWTPVQVGGATVQAGTGTPLRYAWDAHGWLWVVVADAPPDTLDAAVAALPHAPDRAAEQDDGVLDRVGRGLRRIASWLNPFD